jgi:hypothetical protein
MLSGMSCVAVRLAGAALIVAVWLPWRSRRPLRWLRAGITVVLVVGTGLGLEVVRELRDLDHFAPSEGLRRLGWH